MSFQHQNAAEMEVFALHADGSVAKQIPRRVENGRLFFTVDTALDGRGGACLSDCPSGIALMKSAANAGAG